MTINHVHTATKFNIEQCNLDNNVSHLPNRFEKNQKLPDKIEIELGDG